MTYGPLVIQVGLLGLVMKAEDERFKASGFWLLLDLAWLVMKAEG